MLTISPGQLYLHHSKVFSLVRKSTVLPAHTQTRTFSLSFMRPCSLRRFFPFEYCCKVSSLLTPNVSESCSSQPSGTISFPIKSLIWIDKHKSLCQRRWGYSGSRVSQFSSEITWIAKQLGYKKYTSWRANLKSFCLQSFDKCSVFSLKIISYADSGHIRT